jgi:amino acid transporter
MKFENLKKEEKPPSNRGLLVRIAVFNTAILGALTGIGYLVVFGFFGGRLPPQTATWIIIGFYLAALFTTAFVYRFYRKKKLKKEAAKSSEAKTD